MCVCVFVCIHTTSLFTHLLLDTKVACIITAIVNNTSVYAECNLFKLVFLFSLGKYLELLDNMVVLFLIFSRKPPSFPVVAALVYIPSQSAGVAFS